MIRKWIRKIIADEMNEMTDEAVCVYIEDNLDTVAEKAIANIGLDSVGQYIADNIDMSDVAYHVDIDYTELVNKMDDISTQDVAAELDASEIADHVRDGIHYSDIAENLDEKTIAEHLAENMDNVAAYLADNMDWEEIAGAVVTNGDEEKIAQHLDIQAIADMLDYGLLADNLQDMGYKLVLAKEEE
jgi:hypothetical protein